MRDAEQPPEAGVVVRLIAGDIAALREVVGVHGAHLMGVALVITRSPDLAAEAVQDAFVEMWDARTTLDPTRSLRGYLTTIASHRAYDIVRHERVHTRVTQALTDRDLFGRIPADHNAGEQEIEMAELTARVSATLDALPPRCREIFLLRHDGGLSYDEIEALLGISRATIHNQVSRAMRAVAETIERWRKQG